MEEDRFNPADYPAITLQLLIDIFAEQKASSRMAGMEQII